MMTFPIYGKKFQTTNQLLMLLCCLFTIHMVYIYHTVHYHTVKTLGPSRGIRGAQLVMWYTLAIKTIPKSSPFVGLGFQAESWEVFMCLWPRLRTLLLYEYL
jgi:hypothetical protein